MVTKTRTALLAALFLFLSRAASGQDYNYDSSDFYDGSCSFKKLNCAEGSLCVQNPEHTRFQCFCPDGYEGDGYLTDFKADATGCQMVGSPVLCKDNADCNEYADCKPLDSERSSCVCREGFTGKGEIDNGCNDIQECAGNPCAENANCYEEPGGYSCECDATRNYEGDGYTNCTWVCYSHADCAPRRGSCNSNRQCVCDPGYEGDGRTCTDIDECSTNAYDCPDQSTCSNTAGSYTCVCGSGYILKGGECVAMYQTCDEMYKANGNTLEDGRYTLDLDFDGPLAPIEVDCVVIEGVAVTEIAPKESFPATVPSSGGEVPVTYPIDPTALIENSEFCSQEVWLSCTSQFTGGMIQWEDVQGTRRSGWGATVDGVCACGQFRKCPNGCNCGFGAEGVDEGLIMDKGQLPLSKVIFPPVSSSTAGTYRVGQLRCGPQPFDIPRDCQEAKFVYGVEENTPLVIDIDEDGPNAPFLVYCNQEAYDHVGIIEIPPDQLVISRTSAEGSAVEYMVPGPDVNEAIKGSLFCSQQIEYECSSDTMTEAGVAVTTSSGPLTYFPGGSNDQPGSCGCGLTASCEDTQFKCNCEIGDGQARSDQGLIIDRSELPVLNVKSTSADNFYKLGPLQCSQYQFGIQPNCEKLRQADVTDTYSYLIDPDGPTGSLEPFLVECEMDENKGTTVVNNDNGGDLDLGSGKSFALNYLETTPDQVAALKNRSTSCVQTVTFSNCPSSFISIADITYNNGQPITDVLEVPCGGTQCTCGKTITATAKDKIPIYEIKGTAATVSIGPMKCTEIFTDCQSYAAFLREDGVLGESKIAKDALTIDPDGAGDGEPFVVNCNSKETIIQKPTTVENPWMKLKPGKDNPGEVCWNLTYTDQAGAGIGAPQMAALAGTAKDCAQSFTISCENAVGTGMVSYRTCGGTSVSGFVSADVDATCSCGATGTCMGGPTTGCNCDASGDVRVEDFNFIISNEMLPICEVCMELADIEGTGAGDPEYRYIRFDVSDLRCGKKAGRRKNCQAYRQEKAYNSLEEDLFQEMWFDTSGEPIMVGCIFKAEPPTGEMVIRPSEPVYEEGVDYTDGNITIIYKHISFTVIKEAMEGANYCTQDILFFCAAQIPQLEDDYGLFSQGVRLERADYDLRALSSDELAGLCSNTSRYAEQCVKCPNPKRLVITNKDKLPLTNILLPQDSKATVVIDDTKCSYIEKDCDDILKKDLVKDNILDNGRYLIDPDQSGPVPPFEVLCDFIENQGVTQVSSNPQLVNGLTGEGGTDDSADFNFENTYPTATPEQINSLVQNSEFCWQGVKYECEETAISDTLQLTAYNNTVLTSFGTADDSSALGCACNVLGTCVTEGLTCNCDSRGSMVDQGFLTDPATLPVTGVQGSVEAGGSGTLTVTDVRCAPTPVDIPMDCVEAYSWGERNGINYRAQGEYLISPDSANVRPFLVYCDYSDPENPITMIRPEPTDEEPVGDEDPDVEYQGPDDEQIQALVKVSTYCYQPVKVNCYGAKFIDAGVKFTGTDGVERTFWSSGEGDRPTCTCGVENLCGGTESRTAQESRNCNCDIGDDVWRSDAAILRVTEGGPVTKLLTAGVFSADEGRLNLTIGDLVCAGKPLEFNECDNGFNDCAPEATCVDEDDGYRCECPEGWQGKISPTESNPDPPMANGRQCIDDDECSRSNRCRYNSVCQNTPGSYRCNCKQGFRNTDDFTCVDIDECAEGTHDCDENARCVNTNGAFRCRCRKGYRGTGKVGMCHPVGQCACFGDPHCLSFDGRWNHYQGKCTYTMAENNCGGATVEGVPKFKVKTNNWDREFNGEGHYSWIKEAIIEVYGKTIVIGQGRSISVDGVEESSYRMLSADQTTVLLQISEIGFKVQLWTNFGLEVLADGIDEVTVITPENMKNTTCGLCGNYNGNPADDWVVGPKCPPQEGQITDRETLFGNSWSVESEATCATDCDPPEPPKTCNVPELQAEQVCDRLFDAESPFNTSGCFAEMSATDLEAFRFSCEYDLCHTPDLRASQCEVAEALATFCADLLADGFEWRSDDMCGESMCGENEEYKVCGPESEPNCWSPNPVPIENCMESCFCKMGFVREAGVCIEASECGCTYGNTQLAMGEEILSEDCSKQVTCAGHETVEELPNACGENEVCTVDDDGKRVCEYVPTTAPATTTAAPAPPATVAPPPAGPPPVTTDAPAPPATVAPPPAGPPPVTTDAPAPPATVAPPPAGPPPTDAPSPSTRVCAEGDVALLATDDVTVTSEGSTQGNGNDVFTSVPGESVRVVLTPAEGISVQSAAVTLSNAQTLTALLYLDGSSLPEEQAVTVPTDGSVTVVFSGPQRAVRVVLVAEDPSDTLMSSSITVREISGCGEQPDCTESGCTEANTVCRDGKCLCQMGYTADCKTCKDIDECETAENDCVHLGQKCVNTEGSYRCECLEGFVEKDGYCHDINECEDPSTNCGDHAECENLLGTYQCVCCQGYSKNGEQCQRDERLDAVYGAPGEECCACTGDQCKDPDPVCGTDGETYANYGAMVVQGCRDKRTIEVNYKGFCEESCGDVECDKPYAECTQTGPGGAAECNCPECGGDSTPDNTEQVCASNLRVYPSACMFRLIMCEIGRSDITILDSMDPCTEGEVQPVTPWSEWGPCSAECGQGTSTRTREQIQETDLSLEQSVACYETCQDGPCAPGTCNNPGQVCVVDEATNQESCVCPDCSGQPFEPVCGLVGTVVKSYDNECQLQRAACELTKNFQLLENRPCEQKPKNCSVIRNFARLRDADGCVSYGDQDIGFCYGGCGEAFGLCCRPDYDALPQTMATLTFQCPDGNTRTKEEQVITACACVVEPQH